MPPSTARRPGRRLRRYLPFAAGSLQNLLQYRATYFVNMTTTATSAAVMVFLWRAVYAQSPGDGPGGFGVRGVTTYLLVAQLLAVLNTNRVDSDVNQDIYRGDIAVALVRPVSYPVMRFFTAVPVVFTNAVLVALPVLVVFAAIFPLQVPTAGNVLLFAAALGPSILIAFVVNLLAGLAGFVTTNTWGVRIFKDSLLVFLAGQLVPLDLMPAPLRAVASALPFQAMVDSPLRLLLGRYRDGGEAALLLLRQAAWAAAMLVVCALVWRRAVRRVQVLGG